jgi:4'-phosphopantetheinyl transferase
MAELPPVADVWLTFEEDIGSEALLARYETLLDADERRRAGQFRFAVHRRQFVVAHALVRTTLSRYHPVDPAAWRFVHNRWGRPDVCPSVGPPLRFSLSHTEGLVAVAVTTGLEVGVDAEDLGRVVDPLRLAARFFAPAEQAALSALPSAERHQRFLEFWTLKEAFVKAKGRGLSISLDQFWFTVDDSTRVRIDFAAALADDPARWHFTLIRARQRHRVALAVHTRSVDPAEVRATTVVPLLECTQSSGISSNSL